VLAELLAPVWITSLEGASGALLVGRRLAVDADAAAVGAAAGRDADVRAAAGLAALLDAPDVFFGSLALAM
jgi:hypothetical protein